MSEEKKTPRLGKAAGEFNVSTHSIVELLKKKHIEIIDNPNTKLTPEIYDILVLEFQGEKLVKEESKKIDIGNFNKTKQDDNESITEQDIDLSKPVAKPVTTIEESVKIEPEKKIKPEIITPKIVGKINLEKLNLPKKSTKKKIEEEKTDEKVIEKPVEKNIVTETEKSISQPIPSPPIPEHIKTVVEDLTAKIKIIDKIDLDALHPKKTKKKKQSYLHENDNIINETETQIEKQEEKIEDSIVVSTETIITPTETIPTEKENNNFIKTKYEKLQAPIIKGKIDLETVQPKEKELVKKDQQQQQQQQQSQSQQQNDTENADLKKKRKRTKIKHPANKQSNDNNKTKHQTPPKVEISEEDIQRQIRETMQRLEPLGKSKTSKRRREKRQHIQSELRESELQELQNQKILKVTEFITANELATLMNLPVTTIIATCMSVGLFISINQRLDAETISLLAEEYEFEVEFVKADVEEELKLHDIDKEEDLVSRHPIITVMGHVDHGKTSLLDYIRKSNVIAGEAGGITQHIGAYLVNLPDGRKITFLDTPGHEAFTAMRARGAKVTDLCIIVIAADDSVMPQTIEAINHAQAAGVHMVFAITKIDKANANPDKIREALANMNILVEDWGGHYQCQEIDAKHGTNVEILLEKVLLEAEMLELKANPDKNGIGTVLESSLDKGKGYVAKVLIQNGSVKIGDPILAGNFFGKVKALFNERNQLIKSVGPATPILLLGLNGAPQAGDVIRVCQSEHEARTAATKRAQLAREMGLRTQKHITLDEIGRRIAIGDFKELNIIVKGDVDGSVEALSDSLLKLSTDQVQVNVIHKSVGQVTESDVLLASASNAIIVAFQVRPSHGSRKLAEQEQIDIRIYSIIYTAINEIKDAIAGMHTPEVHEKILCNIEIREVFKITKVGNIAGCMVLDGKLQRNTKIRLIRDGIVIYTGKLGSLRRFKDDVKEVVAGQECGLNIENFNDIKVGDIVEGYEEYEVKVTL